MRERAALYGLRLVRAQMAFWLLLTAALAMLTVGEPASAQGTQAEDTAPTPSQNETALEQRSAQLVAILNKQGDLAATFTPQFLQAVPSAQIAALADQLTAQFGRALGVELLAPREGVRASLHIRYERAIAKGGLALDPAQAMKVSEFVLREFEPVDDSPAKIKADLEKLGGEVSAFFGPVEALDTGSAAPLFAYKPARSMPIGSAMKLYVLATLGRAVREGALGWEDVVELDAQSYHSGQLQNWPTGAPVTLHTLASLMISVSDNTATDQLIALLGRDAILETMAASGHADTGANAPFLTTRELFNLKASDDAFLAAYRKATAPKRLRLADEASARGIDEARVDAAFASGPKALDIEWFASAKDLGRLHKYMRATSNLKVFEIMAINKAMPPNFAERWDYVGYKGGSEPGVLNLTWFLTDKQGRHHILSLGWRNEDQTLAHSTLEIMAQRILALAN